MRPWSHLPPPQVGVALDGGTTTLCSGPVAFPVQSGDHQAPQTVPCTHPNMSTTIQAGTGGYRLVFLTTVSSTRNYSTAVYLSSDATQQPGAPFEEVSGSPFSVEIVPGPASIARYLLNSCLLEDASCWVQQQRKLIMPDKQNLVTVVLRDQYDNHVEGVVTAIATGRSSGTETRLTPTKIGTAYHITAVFTSVVDVSHEVCIDVDDQTLAKCLDFDYAAFTSVNQTACSALGCKSFFEGNVALDPAARGACAASGCMLAAVQQNSVRVHIASGWWATPLSTSIAGMWPLPPGGTAGGHASYTLQLDMTRQKDIIQGCPAADPWW